MVETPDTPKQEIKLFYCYAREDKALRDELQIHLSGLRRQYPLTNWHDRSSYINHQISLPGCQPKLTANPVLPQLS